MSTAGCSATHWSAARAGSPSTPTAATATRRRRTSTALTFPASDLLANDAANESGQTLSVTGVGSPVGGTVGLNAGQITFTPSPDFNGAASFSYTVTDNGTTNTV